MITVEDVVQSIIKSDLYWNSKATVGSIVEISINDYENTLDTSLHLLKSFSKEVTTPSIDIIEDISYMLLEYDIEIREELSNHVKLNKLKEIL